VRPYLKSRPNLNEALRLANAFDISREAAVRRYVELHDEILATVFCRDGQFIYAQRNDRFASLCLRKGQQVLLAADREDGVISAFEDVDAADWVYQRVKLAAQTVFQQGGFSTTLLHLEDEEEDEPLEDTYDRFRSE